MTLVVDPDVFSRVSRMAGGAAASASAPHQPLKNPAKSRGAHIIQPGWRCDRGWGRHLGHPDSHRGTRFSPPPPPPPPPRARGACPFRCRKYFCESYVNRSFCFLIFFVVSPLAISHLWWPGLHDLVPFAKWIESAYCLLLLLDSDSSRGIVPPVMERRGFFHIPLHPTRYYSPHPQSRREQPWRAAPCGRFSLLIFASFFSSSAKCRIIADDPDQRLRQSRMRQPASISHRSWSLCFAISTIILIRLKLGPHRLFTASPESFHDSEQNRLQLLDSSMNDKQFSLVHVLARVCW